MGTLIKILLCFAIFCVAFVSGWFAAEVYLAPFWIENTSGLRTTMPGLLEMFSEFARMLRNF